MQIGVCFEAWSTPQALAVMLTFITIFKTAQSYHHF